MHAELLILFCGIWGTWYAMHVKRYTGWRLIMWGIIYTVLNGAILSAGTFIAGMIRNNYCENNVDFNQIGKYERMICRDEIKTKALLNIESNKLDIEIDKLINQQETNRHLIKNSDNLAKNSDRLIEIELQKLNDQKSYHSKMIENEMLNYVNQKHASSILTPSINYDAHHELHYYHDNTIVDINDLNATYGNDE